LDGCETVGDGRVSLDRKKTNSRKKGTKSAKKYEKVSESNLGGEIIGQRQAFDFSARFSGFLPHSIFVPFCGYYVLVLVPWDFGRGLSRAATLQRA
jgi:hypothetical protein